VEEMVMDKQFWQGKRVLLTGHTGFKGSWLSLWLQQLGAEVIGYALDPPTDPSLFVSAKVASGMKSIISDIQDVTKLVQVMQNEQPQIVFHMAAQALVIDSYANPLNTYATNVMGCVHLFEAIRKTKSVSVVVNVTSDKCYENKEWYWGYRETEAMGGFDPYSSSKACAELITSAYRNSFFHPARYADHGVALASVRAGNVIGGGDWALDRLIPDMIRAIQVGKSAKIRHPGAVRPWQHVLEPLKGYLLLAEKLFSFGIECAGAWNFGANDEDAKPVGWVAEKLTSLWGEGAAWEEEAKSDYHEANCLKLDCSKAKSALGWSPRWALEQSLTHVVRWYKNQLNGHDMRAFTLQQINAFVDGTHSKKMEYQYE
jgi:CDP-glucose 4,6-dehydratase